MPMISLIYNNMGNIHAERGDYQRAEYYHRRSLAIRRRIGDPFGVHSVDVQAHDRRDAVELHAAVVLPQYVVTALGPGRTTVALATLNDRLGATRTLAKTLLGFGREAVAEQALDVVADLAHEGRALQIARLDLLELGLPLAGQLRRLECWILDDRGQVAAEVGDAQRLLVAVDVAPGDQGLDDRGACGRCTEAAAAHRLAQLLVVDQLARGLHRGEQGAKEAGGWRLEGKDYVVKEADVMHFRFNV